MNSIKNTILLIISATLIIACDNKQERVARWNVSIRNAPSKSAKVFTWLAKGEKVRLQKTEGKYSHIKLAGGKEGYLETSNLAIQAIVLTTDDVKLLRRPSESSGESTSAKNVKKAAVAFVTETLENEEGMWLKVIGGSTKHPTYKYINGWIKQDYGYDSNNSLVRLGIDLEIAIKKKDLPALKKLANESEPISEMAAEQIVIIEGVDEAPLEEETEVAPESEPVNTEKQATKDAKPDLEKVSE